MRKVTRKSLDELAKVMPVISEVNQKMYVGGTSGATGYTDTTGTTGITAGTGYYGSDNTDHAGGNYGGGDIGGYSSSTGYYGTTGITDSTGYNYGDTGSYTGTAYGDSGYPPYAGEGSTSNPYIPNNGASSNGVMGSGSAYTSNNPCSYDEFDRRFTSGTWLGGFVEGMGYVGMQIISTPSGTSLPMGGEFVTAADLLGESNDSSIRESLSGAIEAVTGVFINGTDKITNVFNVLFSNPNIVAYFKQNPNGQLYKVEQKLSSNVGFERSVTKFYDGDRLIATIVQ